MMLFDTMLPVQRLLLKVGLVLAVGVSGPNPYPLRRPLLVGRTHLGTHRAWQLAFRTGRHGQHVSFLVGRRSAFGITS